MKDQVTVEFARNVMSGRQSVKESASMTMNYERMETILVAELVEQLQIGIHNNPEHSLATTVSPPVDSKAVFYLNVTLCVLLVTHIVVCIVS